MALPPAGVRARGVPLVWNDLGRRLGVPAIFGRPGKSCRVKGFNHTLMYARTYVVTRYDDFAVGVHGYSAASREYIYL